MRRRYHQSAIDVALQVFSSVKRQVFQQLHQCPEDYYYILPVGGFGELVFTLSQSHHLRSDAKVCMLLRQDRAYLAEMWPQAADHFIFLSTDQFNLLRSIEDYSYRHPGWLFICWADLFADGRFAIDLVLNNNRLTMKEMYSYALGLNLSVPLLPPVVSQSEVQLPSQDANRVLVIQHANTYARIPANFWAKLTERLVSLGYQVLIDVVADQDLIPGSPAEVSYYRTKVPGLLSIARSVDLVIALRSGMADLIGSVVPDSPLRMIVLYHITKMFDGKPNRFHHSPGISKSGLNLAESFQTPQIHDIEICSDDGEALVGNQVEKVMELVYAPRHPVTLADTGTT